MPKPPLSKLTGPEQIQVMRNLTQDAVAWIAGATGRTLRDHPECPRKRTGRYDGRAVVEWVRGTLDKTSPADMLAGPTSPALERYREERAAMAKLDRLERENTLMSRADVYEGMTIAGTRMRRACSVLQKRFGPDALQIIHDALDDVDRLVEERFGDGGTTGEAA